MNSNPMNNFQRDISYRISNSNDGRIRLSATMRDRYHDIVLEVVVNGETLKIEGVVTEFRKCPTTECPNAAERLNRLTGIVIGKGLNKHIAEAMGGEDGCGNLRNLLLGLLPLAINVKAAAGFTDEQAMLDEMSEHMRGACAGYPRHTT
ncbi:MAG: hypothetical protein A2X80_14330 [Geobacteraceae bacterium GWB2_52_12]|nr:MAG: hypothetical protein A2X80_14330 [Geobacteraceae bacterium GWB2_52_12]